MVTSIPIMRLSTETSVLWSLLLCLWHLVLDLFRDSAGCWCMVYLLPCLPRCWCQGSSLILHSIETGALISEIDSPSTCSSISILILWASVRSPTLPQRQCL